MQQRTKIIIGGVIITGICAALAVFLYIQNANNYGPGSHNATSVTVAPVASAGRSKRNFVLFNDCPVGEKRLPRPIYKCVPLIEYELYLDDDYIDLDAITA